MIKNINECRICKNKNLVSILNLGKQHLTGVFPKLNEPEPSIGELELVKCHGNDIDNCGLIQLSASFELDEMYGDNYGYRSSLNNSMLQHLKSIVENIKTIVKLNSNDLIIDIGSNDGSTLSFYDENKFKLVGIDPTAERFREYYRKNTQIISEFFSGDIIENNNFINKAKIITSFAMFYDLEDPIEFSRNVSRALNKKEGIWVLEQSYLPSMLSQNAYDTICHEHLEYYALKQIKWILDKSDMRIIDIELTDTNGGSFVIYCSHNDSIYQVNEKNIYNVENYEKNLKLNELKIYNTFYKNILQSRDDLKKFIKEKKNNNEKIFGIGASTKGNVILQFCDFSPNDIESIGEINKEKFGSMTPGTNIPIISEKEVLESDCKYLLILPWHFKNFFLNSKNFKNKTLIFPLPKLEIIDC